MTACTFPVRLEDWEHLVEALPSPWPHAAALVDLRHHQARGRIPTREDLADRWGWDTARTGELVADRGAWLDRSLPPPELPPGEIVATRPVGRRRYRPSVDRPTHLDFEGRHREMLALARKHPQYLEVLRGWRTKGYERDDLDHELLVRLAARQELPDSAYDPSRSGFGKYVYTAMGSLLLHLVETAGTLKETRISTGVYRQHSVSGGDVYSARGRYEDAADAAVADLWDPVSDIDAARSQLGAVAPSEEGR